jgi:hypothetical protein
METEETLSELSFEKSCNTKVLKAKSVFLSAYPGYIVFGKTLTTVYEAKNYFKFYVFELYKLYIAIIKILTFLTEENSETLQGLILKRNFNTVYYWSGITLNIDGKDEKFVVFNIETEVKTIKLQMNISELHNLISALKSSIIICLCLSTQESEILSEASQIKVDLILKLKNYSDTKHFVEQFLKKYNYKEHQETYKLTQVVSYYTDIIILLHKFTSMSNFNENVFEEILSVC